MRLLPCAYVDFCRQISDRMGWQDVGRSQKECMVVVGQGDCVQFVSWMCCLKHFVHACEAASLEIGRFLLRSRWLFSKQLADFFQRWEGSLFINEAFASSLELHLTLFNCTPELCLQHSSGNGFVILETVLCISVWYVQLHSYGTKLVQLSHLWCYGVNCQLCCIQILLPFHSSDWEYISRSKAVPILGSPSCRSVVQHIDR